MEKKKKKYELGQTIALSLIIGLIVTVGFVGVVSADKKFSCERTGYLFLDTNDERQQDWLVQHHLEGLNSTYIKTFDWKTAVDRKNFTYFAIAEAEIPIFLALDEKANGNFVPLNPEAPYMTIESQMLKAMKCKED